MNYEEKYKEALEKAKTFYETKSPDCLILESIFPELAESEDERIRKELIEALKQLDKEKTPVDSYPYLEWVAWLKKQDEQKSFDYENANIPQKDFAPKTEPKFKAGEWITNGEVTFKIDKVFDTNYTDTADAAYNIEHIDANYHLWTIEDAKDGDLLEFSDHGRLVIGIVSYVNKVTGKVDVNCLLENNNFKLGIYYNLDTIKPHPANMEQRIELFQKMHEAGYEWNAEKKELIKNM